MLRDPGCYAERYRLTGGAVLTLAASLLSIGLGVLWHMPVIFAVIAVLIAALEGRAHGLCGAAGWSSSVWTRRASASATA